MMLLEVKRQKSNDKCTIGRLYVNGVFQCYTLEDVVRPEKIKAQTAIPVGEYDVVITMSNRFKKLLPLLRNVPNFDGVRIHAGNTDSDTEGCILVGESAGQYSISGSRSAFDKLFAQMQKADSIKIKIGEA